MGTFWVESELETRLGQIQDINVDSGAKAKILVKILLKIYQQSKNNNLPANQKITSNRRIAIEE